MPHLTRDELSWRRALRRQTDRHESSHVLRTVVAPAVLAVALAARGATGHKVSTLQDIEHGRRLEIDEIMGYAVRKAGQLGLSLPTVETCYRLVAGFDRAWRGG